MLSKSRPIWLALMLCALGTLAVDAAGPQRPPPQQQIAVPNQAAPPAVQLGTRIALVIGNSAYQHTTALANPANDARDMATALRQVGFQVIDGVDLGKRDLEIKTREFAQALSSADTALLFYAGHGLQVGGQNYLIPVDARLAGERDLEFDAVRVDFILRQMEIDRDAKTNIVFLDACRDNPLAKNLARTMGTRSAAIGQGLAQVQTGVGTFISYSTQPGNVALDGDGRNSPFTTALLKQIRVAGRNLNGMMIEVRKDVLAATGGRQVPWDHSALTGDFYFVPTSAPGLITGSTPGPLPPAPDVTELQERMRKLEAELNRREQQAPPNTADLIRQSEVKMRVQSLSELTQQLQRRVLDLRMQEGRASDPAERARYSREAMAAQMELSRRGLDLKKAREELAEIEAATKAAALPPPSNVMAPDTAAEYNIRDGAMLNGSELGNARVPTFEDCRQRCDQTQGCVAFQHEANSSVCLMFSRVTFRTAAANWRAGVKRGADKP